jgi:hypothetical protein
VKWEYHIEELVYDDESHRCQKLDELGADGWELVSVVDTGNVESDTGCPYFALVFKRPLESKKVTT